MVEVEDEYFAPAKVEVKADVDQVKALRHVLTRARPDVWVIELEQVGDYADHYQRPSDVIAYDFGEEGKKALEAFWEDLPISGAFEDKPLKSFDGVEYIAANIYSLPNLEGTS
jgi:hypothetical protein